MGTAHGQQWNEAALTALAREVAAEPFVPEPLPSEELIALDYDRYRLIAWKPEMALWRYLDAPIQAELMHRGNILRNRVQISTVQDAEVVTLAFDRNLFEYRGDVVGLPVDAGVDYAGMKLLGELPESEYMQEFFAWAGASYFRGISAGQVYGASCRALAIDIGTNRVEEFPVIRALWLQRPEVGATTARVWGLLDSHAVAGAFRFDVTPGEVTTCDVRATLFFRHVPTKVGVAPASSMFLWGDGYQNLKADDRPEVHDSDGLLIHAGEGEELRENGPPEWTFRALGQQQYPSVGGFGYGSIRGFGLLQRDRDPARYADPETRYEDRPSTWITPLPPEQFGTGPGAVNGADWDDVPNAWAGGTVELLEYPTDFEGFDNIAAWWVPAVKPTVGEPYPLAYRISFLSGDPPGHDLAKAAAWTRNPAAGGATELTVDFTGDFPFAAASAVATVECDGGAASSVRVAEVPRRGVPREFDGRARRRRAGGRASRPFQPILTGRRRSPGPPRRPCRRPRRSPPPVRNLEVPVPAQLMTVAEHERPTAPPPAREPAGVPAPLPAVRRRAIPAGTLVDAAAVDAARDAVARYLEELGLPLNSRSLNVAVAACLDAALGDVGPDADRPALVHGSLRHAAHGIDRWLGDLVGRVPAPPPHRRRPRRPRVGRAPPRGPRRTRPHHAAATVRPLKIRGTVFA